MNVLFFTDSLIIGLRGDSTSQTRSWSSEVLLKHNSPNSVSTGDQTLSNIAEELMYFKPYGICGLS